MSKLFPRRLKQARDMRGITQLDLSKLAGLAPSAVSHFETGSRRPSLDNLVKISKALNVTTDYLVGISRNTQEGRFDE